MIKKPKPRPIPMRITDIHIKKQDYPRQFPPDNGGFDALKRSLRKKGIVTPIFVDADGVLISGHYRLWAWQSLGNKHVPTIVIEKEEEVLEYFTQR